MKKFWIPILIVLVIAACLSLFIGGKKPVAPEESLSSADIEHSSIADQVPEVSTTDESETEPQPTSEQPVEEEINSSELPAAEVSEIPERFTQADSPYYIPEDTFLNSLPPEVQQCARDHIDWQVSIGTKSPWAYAPGEYNGDIGFEGPASLEYISNDWFDFDMSGGYSQDEVDACRDCICTDDRIELALEILESFGRETTLEAAEEYIMDTYGNGVYEGGSTFRGTYERAVAASK